MKNTFLKSVKLAYIDNAVTAGEQFVKWMHRATISMSGITADAHKVDTIKFGKMYLFSYDPKTKNTLPYYDTFPLVLPMEPKAGGFIGLNFHYIDPFTRGRLLNSLRNDKISDLLLSYNAIKKNKVAKTCLKRYLTTHVRSKFIEIEPEDWDWIIYLSLEDFVNSSSARVWADSRMKF